jgi:DHA1 family bicyclomycin/chloramphenicol resistance-like MFS transporter
MVLPQAQAGALLPFPERAGAASSLVGLVQQVLAAVVGALLGQLIGATAWPLAASIVTVSTAALLIWVLTRRIRRA